MQVRFEIFEIEGCGTPALGEALRRIEAAMPDLVDLAVLRRTLENELTKGPCSLVKLIKVGRRKTIDRSARAERAARKRDQAC